MPPRVVLLSMAAAPSESGSGSSVLFNGFGEALKQIGFAVTYVVGREEEAWRQPDTPHGEVRYIEPDHTTPVADWLPAETTFYRSPLAYAASVERALAELEPAIVVCYSCAMWVVLRRVKTPARRVLLTVDREYEVYRLRRKLKKRSLAPRSLFHTLRRHYQEEQLRALEHTYAREAECVFCCAAHHAEELRQEGATVHYVPAPMVGTAQRRAIADREGPLKICLLGNLNGTQTRHGLRYFFDRIWPLYLHSDLVGKIQFVVIGGGALPPEIPWPASHPDLVATGFVRDLDAALADISALLVSIPNTLGFRMRILEAFKQGIPVIAHEAACAGMPELTEETAFLGNAPRDFLDAFRALIDDPQRAERRAEAGARCFDRVFAAGRVAEKLAPFFEALHPLSLAESRHDDR